MRRSTLLIIGAVLIGLWWGNDARAGEFRLVATQIAPDRAIWQPSLVLIDNKIDIEGGLVFILENLTTTSHIFAVDGLSILGSKKTRGEKEPARLSVTVGPNETKRVPINTGPLLTVGAEGRKFQVQCPIHVKGHLSGSIFVVSGQLGNLP